MFIIFFLSFHLFHLFTPVEKIYLGPHLAIQIFNGLFN